MVRGRRVLASKGAIVNCSSYSILVEARAWRRVRSFGHVWSCARRRGLSVREWIIRSEGGMKLFAIVWRDLLLFDNWERYLACMFEE